MVRQSYCVHTVVETWDALYLWPIWLKWKYYHLHSKMLFYSTVIKIIWTETWTFIVGSVWWFYFFILSPKILDEIVPIVRALVGGGRLLGRPLVGGGLEQATNTVRSFGRQTTIDWKTKDSLRHIQTDIRGFYSTGNVCPLVDFF